MNRYFIILLLVTAKFACSAQETYTIKFDESGKIVSQLPERLRAKDRLIFYVDNTNDDIGSYVEQLNTTLKNAQKNIKKTINDSTQMAVFGRLYGITKTDLEKVDSQIKELIKNSFRDSAERMHDVPCFTKADTSYYTISILGRPSRESISVTAGKISDTIDIGKSGTAGKISFSLAKKDPFKALVKNWLDSTEYGPTFNPKRYDVLRDSTMPELTRLLADGKICLSNNLIDSNTRKQQALELEQQISNMHNALQLNSVLVGYKNWVLRWIWYNKGQISLNPFRFRRPEELPQPDTSLISGIRIMLQTLDAVFQQGEFIKKAKLEVIEALVRRSDSLRLKMAAVQKSYRRDSILNAQNDALVKDFATINSLLVDEGTLLYNCGNSRDTQQSVWSRHHNAANGNEIMNTNTKQEYLENDKVAVIVHNLTLGQKADIRISFKDISNDESTFSEVIRRSIPNYESATAYRKEKATRSAIPLRKVLDALSAKVDTLTQDSLALAYLSNQTNPVASIKALTEKSAAYHSQIANSPKTIDGPKKAVYYLKIADKQMQSSGASAPSPDTFTYRINKLYRIFPMAGLNYSFTKFNDISYDAGRKQFRSITESRAKFAIGIKVFPLRKIDIRDTRFCGSRDDNGRRLLASRLSFALAFDAATPKNNFYTGVGLDLWPGFCVNSGAIFNRYSYNQYADGTIMKTQERYRIGFYVGISTDVALFTDIVKLLNFSK